MTKKKLLWIALPLVAVLGIGVAGAGYKHSGGHHNPERMVERVSQKLDLNEEQIAKLVKVKKKKGIKKIEGPICFDSSFFSGLATSRS